MGAMRAEFQNCERPRLQQQAAWNSRQRWRRHLRLANRQTKVCPSPALPDMKRYRFRGLLLIVLALGLIGCGTPKRPAPRTVWAPLQTGSNMGRRITVEDSTEQAKPKTRRDKPKASREKPRRERRTRPVDDEDFVPRGGFR